MGVYLVYRDHGWGIQLISIENPRLMNCWTASRELAINAPGKLDIDASGTLAIDASGTLIADASRILNIDAFETLATSPFAALMPAGHHWPRRLQQMLAIKVCATLAIDTVGTLVTSIPLQHWHWQQMLADNAFATLATVSSASKTVVKRQSVWCSSRP